MHPHIDDAAHSHVLEDVQLLLYLAAVLRHLPVILSPVMPYLLREIQIRQKDVAVLPVHGLVDALHDIVDLKGGDVFRKDADDIALAGAQGPGRQIGLIAELRRGLLHFPGHIAADLVHPFVDHIRYGRRGDTGLFCYVFQSNHLSILRAIKRLIACALWLFSTTILNSCGYLYVFSPHDHYNPICFCRSIPHCSQVNRLSFVHFLY